MLPVPSENANKKPTPVSPYVSITDQKSPLMVELMFTSSLEEAQLNKLDHLIARANVQPTDNVLDIGFGWGGLAIRLAETVGCRVTGITLSKEQHDLALERVKARNLQHLIRFEIIDYRIFAQQHKGEFDKIISIEMIEAVGFKYFPSFMSALETLLAPNGIIVLQAITLPEGRYDLYLNTADFINTIIFPGGLCPSIAALTTAMQKAGTNLMLTNVENFALHYAETLRRWRANFNIAIDDVIRPLGFDDSFIRTWNYYLTYCEAGFHTQTLGLQVLVFTRPQNTSFMTGNPPSYSSLMDPMGPFINSPANPHIIPAGVF
jgi:cyclopropane-fatty-acyl-phospholipid synthase